MGHARRLRAPSSPRKPVENERTSGTSEPSTWLLPVLPELLPEDAWSREFGPAAAAAAAARRPGCLAAGSAAAWFRAWLRGLGSELARGSPPPPPSRLACCRERVLIADFYHPKRVFEESWRFNRAAQPLACPSLRVAGVQHSLPFSPVTWMVVTTAHPGP